MTLSFETILKSLAFKHDWRSYQKRVLQELERHMEDTQLHVVAAPGSGKTVLGLEVMRRLGRPAIVFAPSLAIRNQWKARLVELFLPEDADISWISFDVRNPGPLTIVTYQGFHAALSGDASSEDGEERDLSGLDLITRFKDQGVGTLVFDEAHHLRKDWQRSLVRLREALPACATTVSLTATPPYDTDASEWDSYEALCGPIDCEISVPELIKTGDLCPHQDLVCFSAPTDDETRFIDAFAENVNGFAYNLLNDERFLSNMARMPWFADPLQHEEEVFKNSGFFLAGLVFLKAAGRTLPAEALQLFGLEEEHVPALNRDFLERLVAGVLTGDGADWFDEKGCHQRLKTDLKAFGGIRGDRPMLANMDKIDRLLRNSLGKIQSIRSIVAAESSNLGAGLRMVILTDHIYRDLMPSPSQRVYEPVKIGVVPLFEVLREHGDYFYKVGVLTGSLVVLPVEAVPLYREAAAAKGIAEKDFSTRPLSHAPDYVEIELRGAFQHESVRLVTEVFERGGVTVLVGTQSLLGEGWDAPSINALVLASTVGSFMLSNQMRGRAIRTDPNAPRKTANIWHLACVTLPEPKGPLNSLDRIGGVKLPGGRPGYPRGALPEDLGQDRDLLVRRFKAFEGLSVSDPPFIETGLGRLGFENVSWTPEGLERINGATFARSADRVALAVRWESALYLDTPGARLRPMVTTRRPAQKWVYRHPLRSLSYSGLAALLPVAGMAVSGVSVTSAVVLTATALLGLGVAFLRGFNPLRTAALVFRNRNKTRNLSQIARVVLEALAATDQLESPLADLTPVVQKLHEDHLCSLEGAQPKERAVFLDCLAQLLGPIDNPKYILLRRARGLGKLLEDYHPVPDCLSGKKADAEVFARLWNGRVSDAVLVSARSREGRKVLLRARARAYASEEAAVAERLGRWQ
ncbi:DEAD/DEAH box helicase family protein [Roseibium aggregatum]|uniref:DEAD/DEAH box helicase family protein n=1 Tax=Roseibium aggregatum TaxID=187304 RepID=A0A939ED08_9HYPH|nr:DEAD/DEAH box helicase family protein [Roseibium aggregatum]MBN9670910.1 DEAD/DEAH box helicase family protein [Roseibium aggregatum]